MTLLIVAGQGNSSTPGKVLPYILGVDVCEPQWNSAQCQKASFVGVKFHLTVYSILTNIAVFMDSATM